LSFHEGRHRGGLTDVDVADARAPDFFARLRINGHGLGIEQVVDNLAAGIGSAAIHDVTAGDADRTRVGMGFIDELDRARRLGQVDRNQVVGERRNHVERVVHDQRIALVTVRHAGRRRGQDVQVHHI